MRKSRFLLNLIAATAIGLSVFGCDSSDSEFITTNGDLLPAPTGPLVAGTTNLREYLILAERGLEPIAPNFGANQGAPAGAGAVIAGAADAVATDSRAQLFELDLLGEADAFPGSLITPGSATPVQLTLADITNPIPTPIATVQPSFEPQNTPVGPGADAGTSGFHQIYASPQGRFAIGMSRAGGRNLNDGLDGAVDSANLQVFMINRTQNFPATFELGPPLNPLPIITFSPNQGNFVSGAWSPDGAFFYASVNGSLGVFSVEPTNGSLEESQPALPLAAGPVAGIPNNALEILVSESGQFIYTVDNANGQVQIFSRDPATDIVSQIGQVPTGTDPRGATIDRSGNFMYVAGRSSATVAGYSIGADGLLTPIDVLGGIGPVPAPLGVPIGDVDANPQDDTLYVSSYSGVMQAFSIDPATGGLTSVGDSAPLLGGSRNTTNIEVDPSGAFVLSVQEHDADDFQDFVTLANGFPAEAVENPSFANPDTASNGPGGAIFSLTPQLDASGRTLFALLQPFEAAFAGDLQVFRIEEDGVSVRAERSVDTVNPFGLTFFQRVIEAPVDFGFGFSEVIPDPPATP